MAAQQQGGKWPVIAGIDPNKLFRDFDAWVKSQHPAVEVAIVTLTTAFQGGVTGYLFGYMFKELGSTAPPGDALGQQLKTLQAGGPIGQARSFAVLMGANTGLSLAIKKIRNGKEDVWSSMYASFGAGFLYSLTSGQPNAMASAFSMGATFALFNGLIYQVSNAFKPAPETDYEHGKGLLTHLGLQKYYENLRKQLLTDNTIMLWNDSALRSANIPAGPRLLILHHLDSIRNPAHARSGYLPVAHHPLGSVLKPALAVGPSGQVAPPLQQQQAASR